MKELSPARSRAVYATALAGLTVFALVFVAERALMPSTRALPMFVAIALFCLAPILIVRRDNVLRSNRGWAATFCAAALLLLAAASVLYLLRLQQAPPTTQDYAWEHQDAGELATLDPDYRYWMDGHLDEWTYVLFNRGLTFTSFGMIPIEEKGLLYFYAALLRLAGDFNTYLLVVVNCVAQVLSAWLLFRVALRFAPPVTAFAAAMLLLAMPDALYWGASTLHKDNFVVLIVVFCLWSGLNAFTRDRVRWSHAVAYAAGLLALGFVRSGLVLPLVCGGLLAIVLSRRHVLPRMGAYAAALAGVAVLSTVVLPAPVSGELRLKVLDRVVNRLGIGSSYQLDVQNIQFRTTQEDSLIYRLSGGDLSLKKAYYAPVRAAMYFVAPFPPWPPRTPLDWFVLPATWLLVPFWFFFLYGCWRSLRPPSAAAVWSLAFFVVIAVAIAFAGGFVHERYRVLMMPFYWSFAMLGVYAASVRVRTGLLLGSLGAFVALLALYAALK